jgi:PAS domain S-box-containing protein
MDAAGVEELNKSERKLSSILAGITDCHYELDRDLRFTLITNRALAYFGRTREQIIGQPYFDVFPILKDSIFREQFSKAISESTSVHFDSQSILHPGRWINFHGYPTEEGGVAVFFRDITEHKQTEAALRESEAKYRGLFVTEYGKAEEALKRAAAYDRSLIEASVDPLVTINPQGMIADVNIATEQVTGYSREKLIGTDFCDYFTDPGKAKAGYERVFKKGIVRDYELEILHKNGHTTPILYNASVYRDESGKVVGVFAAARDISQRKHVEQVLRESEERYRIAIESASDGVALMRDSQHIYVSKRFAEIFGYDDPNEIIGKSHALTVHPDDLAMVSEINRKRQNGEAAPSRYEFRGVRKDGTLRNIDVSATMT